MNEKRAPKPGILDHVTFEVKDLDEALQFYTRILGLKEQGTPDNVKAQGVLWLQWQDGTAFHLVHCAGMSMPILGHLAVSVEDADAWRDYISAMGVDIEGPKVQVYNAKRFFIRDPSGNRLEFVQWLDPQSDAK